MGRPDDGYDWVVTDLWAQQRQGRVQAVEPLAVRMRPRKLEEFVGQEHLLGPGAAQGCQSACPGLVPL